MAAMHLLIRLVALVTSVFVVVAADQAELRKIEESNRIFDLRRALDQRSDNQRDERYFRAVIEARFGREEAAVEHLRAFLATNPDERLTRKAHDELANALIRLGRYGEAAVELDQMLRLMSSADPERASTSNTRAIFTALKDVSPQTVEFGTEKSLVAKSSKLGLWSVFLEANTRQAEWVFDTGMTFSTVTESEAKRVGLTLLDSGGRGSPGHTGKELPVHLAIASDLRIGSAHLRNVVCAVVADKALNFGSDRLRGIIGLPTIRALMSIAVSASGVVRIHSDSTKPQREPNMFFDGLTPIVEVRHAGRAVPMTLDTGGTTTHLYSSFRETLTPAERATLSRQNRSFAGVGGSIKVETELLPKLELELPGRIVAFSGVALRSDTPNPYSDGVLGIDALKGGFAIDFDAMRLELD